ncbi:NADH-quinone oxidoreductase subunit E [Desulfitispora alkaliphila]|uniref:NADH-quinone oxidoreductase subunit NuoE n=1 Tax=Desulfitispora alkaliphila TaxID=622674 RepID=UPI003D1C21D4
MCNCCQQDQQVETEKELKLKEVIGKFCNQRGALIPVLQAAQDIYGYLPKEVLIKISEDLNLPLSKVYGVVTFYAQFHLKPRGRHIIRVCLGTACHVRGGAKVLERIEKELGISDGSTTEDLRYTLESVACIGACGLAPVIMVGDDTHGRLEPEQIPEILEKYE